MSFTKMIAVSCIIFLVVVFLLEFVFISIKVDAKTALASFSDPKYILKKVVAAIIYGVIIAIIYKRKLKKSTKN